MFELTEETRKLIIERIRSLAIMDQVGDDQINDAIDDILVIVKKQFGF